MCLFLGMGDVYATNELQLGPLLLPGRLHASYKFPTFLDVGCTIGERDELQKNHRGYAKLCVVDWVCLS